jgi:hypothetical protein
MQGSINNVLELDRLGARVLSVCEPWLDTSGPVRRRRCGAVRDVDPKSRRNEGNSRKFAQEGSLSRLARAFITLAREDGA